MSATSSVTRKDIDDVISILDVMITRIDERFSKVEVTSTETQKQVQNILNQLDITSTTTLQY